MPLTDQEITDNFPLLVGYYLKLNNLTSITYNAEQIENQNIVITSWDDTIIQAPSYETFRNYCLDTICKKNQTCDYMNYSCPIIRNTLFKSLHKLFTETNIMNATDTIAYLASISGLTTDQISEILQ